MFSPLDDALRDLQSLNQPRAASTAVLLVPQSPKPQPLRFFEETDSESDEPQQEMPRGDEDAIQEQQQSASLESKYDAASNETTTNEGIGNAAAEEDDDDDEDDETARFLDFLSEIKLPEPREYQRQNALFEPTFNLSSDTECRQCMLTKLSQSDEIRDLLQVHTQEEFNNHVRSKTLKDLFEIWEEANPEQYRRDRVPALLESQGVGNNLVPVARLHDFSFLVNRVFPVLRVWGAPTTVVDEVLRLTPKQLKTLFGDGQQRQTQSILLWVLIKLHQNGSFSFSDLCKLLDRLSV